MKLEHCLPGDIEKRSFEIIEAELGDRARSMEPDQKPVILRVIHTTADFDYADSLAFSPGAVEAGIRALRAGATLVTDTRMAFSGVSKPALQKLGGDIRCFMADEDVAAEAKARGSTRAAASMDRACLLEGPLVFAVGNAPTALVRLCELMHGGRVRPALVIGAPVGFVNVEASKELLMAGGAPYIVARGRKGGSTVAAAVCNALLYQAAGRSL